VQIAYQGEPGAYSEAAGLRVSAGAEMVPCESFDQVFAAVAQGRVTHGILPIENSIGGSIHRNYDLLIEHNLPIVGEIEFRVVHQLLAYPGTTLDEITRIYSHPQALAQCEQFLRSMPQIEVVATYDTAGSAKMIREGGLRDAAAIASERAAQVFGLTVLKSGIQDYDDNITRFLLIGKSGIPLGVPDKTTVVFTMERNEPGSLFKALSVFALRSIDLTKLESRPVRGKPWEYLFYVDVAAGRQEPRCERALDHLAEFATTFRMLGSYPSWQQREAAERAASADHPTSVTAGLGHQ
jgi:prephenate dehydratase